MKPLISAIALGVASNSFAAEEISISLVQYRVGASLSDEVPFDVKPMGHSYGADLAFLVKGEGLVSFKEDALEIASFVSSDGKELSKSKSGNPNWKEGSFPKVSDDGDLAMFSVEVRGDLMGKLEGGTISGSAVMFTSGETDKASKKLSKGEKPVDMGPFKVSIEKGGMFGGDGTPIKIQGDYASIIELIVTDGDKKLDSSGSSWNGDTKTFSFGKASGDELEVTIRYWKNLSEVKVPFKITVGG